MSTNAAEKSIAIPGYRYQSPHIPTAAIRRFARQLGERFHPHRIILFGSYAYGQPHAGSDVDLLVVMPAASEVNQSIRMTLAFEPPFPLDLIVRTPAKLKRRLAEGDRFLEQIMARGKVVYEERNPPLGSQGRNRPRRRKRSGPSRSTVS
jgi:predicted nucleotidyltransferase